LIEPGGFRAKTALPLNVPADRSAADDVDAHEAVGCLAWGVTTDAPAAQLLLELKGWVAATSRLEQLRREYLTFLDDVGRRWSSL